MQFSSNLKIVFQNCLLWNFSWKCNNLIFVRNQTIICLASKKRKKRNYHLYSINLFFQYLHSKFQWIEKKNLLSWYWVVKFHMQLNPHCVDCWNPTIYNIIRWFTGSLGQMTSRPSVWCSKYYFFFTICCKNRFNLFLIFLIDLQK